MSEVDNSSTNQPIKEDPIPCLGAFEEGDQLEVVTVADWDDSETNLSHLTSTKPGAEKSGGDTLWEDNWDDDDIEDEYSVQLRAELGKAKSGSDAMQN